LGVRTSLIALGLALGLALAACGRPERTPPAAGPPAAPRRGPDLLVLRTSRTGGQVRVFAFPRLDSLVWNSTARAPALDRILGFDDAAGIVLAEAPKGVAVRIDLRLGTITPDAAPKMRALTSADGSAAFGVGPEGAVVRVTPSGTWSFKPPAPARDVLPQPDGQLLVLGDHEGGAVIWSVRPPDSTITDSAVLPPITRAVRTPVGDRVYFTAGDKLLAFRVRALEALPPITLPRPASAVVTTPSGDRIYVAPDSLPELLVFDRYTSKIAAHIALPSPVAGLRMDPLGRLVLARLSDDSTVVVAVGTDKPLGVFRGAWRADLPAVAPNGWLAVVAGKDVVFIAPDSMKVMRTVAGGAADLWAFLSWNGFRPRAAALDEPVTFPEDTVVPRDSANPFAEPVPLDTGHRAVDTTLAAAPAAPPRDTAPRGPQFTIQFAALRTDSAARQVMRTIHLAGAVPRVVPNAHDGVITYRVVIGPFASREEAERIAHTAGMSYWIYEGAP
jgi:cell division septation protein DedD